jgi:hypothetical protein
MDVLPTLNKHANSMMTIKNSSIRPSLQRTVLTGLKCYHSSIGSWFIIETQ